jgi:hypothetical protein
MTARKYQPHGLAAITRPDAPDICVDEGVGRSD